MGWMETRVVDERMRFVMAVADHEEAFAVVCRRFGVSRRTGYKWLERYDAEGVAGLMDRSRAPHSHPQAIAAPLAERCLAVRRAHPTWGPVKIRHWLAERDGATEWPAPSTIGALLDREGLTVKRRLRRRSPPSSVPFGHCGGANDIWCMDFKGWFLTGDGSCCEPLTLSDAYSRYLLRCQALARTDTAHVWPVLEAAFREFGLPHRLRSDNGPPFASCGAGGLSRLAVQVIKAGVVPERIAPGKPQQNGRLERLHLTLKQDTAMPPAQTLPEQLKRLRAFQRLYNEERPHQALGNDTPSQHYARSPRRFDGCLRAPDYGPDQTVRRVRSNGAIKWGGNEIYINEALAGEPIGLTEQPNGSFAASYGPIVLGVIAHRGNQLRKAKRGCGLVDNAARCPQGPTASTADAEGLNKTRNVLPMSPVKTVTHVPGCTRRMWRGAVLDLRSTVSNSPLPAHRQPSSPSRANARVAL
uniref:Integrase, catalytic region n=1 Tax=Rhodopseudomonas palustris (strain BisA53) TaxID=316055 RepID=Q07TU7_RHOP5